jgi:hypothetical protein
MVQLATSPNLSFDRNLITEAYQYRIAEQMMEPDDFYLNITVWRLEKKNGEVHVDALTLLLIRGNFVCPGTPCPGTPTAAPAPNAELSAAEIADQLGLKLNPAEGSVETLVIDHVERPSPN